MELIRLLGKEVLRDNLAKAGLYVLAYELLKDSIIERPKAFFTLGGSESDDHYRAEVLSRHQNRLIASCLWFQENGAMSEEEARDVLEFREHRNYIAHQLPDVLLNPVIQVDKEKLDRLFRLLCKIDRWWISEFEIPTNPDFDGQEIAAAEARSGAMEFVAYLISVVYGLDDAAAKPARTD
ncbi:MAG: hypothetical protein WAM39_31335 [Bryobacteraceae bacterium]